jgi:nicotinate-nucleotide--dimethylbenzimidazole phosphoribosyltransferase
VRRGVAPLSVGEVAAAVDAGRAVAAQAKAEGATVLAGSGPGADRERVAELAEAAAGAAGRPLRALRLHGDSDLAFLCGLALGAGEQGLAFACRDDAARAAAAIAVAVEPDLAGQLR